MELEKFEDCAKVSVIQL